MGFLRELAAYTGLAVMVWSNGCSADKIGKPDKAVESFTPYSGKPVETVISEKLSDVKLEEESKEQTPALNKDSCQNLEIGVIGASNTVESKGREGIDDLFENRCEGTEVYIYAKGGRGPRGQRFLLSYMLSKHPDLDYVILNPSENEMVRDSLEDYIINVVFLAESVKRTNADTKVLILTNTPSKGHSQGKPWGWTAELQVKKDQFNANLLNNKLGRPDLIDFAVDTYSAVEDPPGSDECGRYCNIFNDKVHLGTEGQIKVVDAILAEAFDSR